MMCNNLIFFVCLCVAPGIHFTVAQSTATWCTIATNEKAKCDAMKTAFASKGLSPALKCVQGVDHDDCLKKIHSGEADLITLDGGDIYTAGFEYDMQTVMAEKYSDGQGYYAVAVAKKSATDVNINSLKGKRSCHTGVRKTAGWNVPVGYLLGEGLMDAMGCNSIKSTGAFFSQSCAPGALLPKYNPNDDNPTSLCGSCIGEGDSRCARSSAEPYYNYDGAFRCLVDGAGDVAFVKHLTVPSYTDGKSDKSWANGQQSADYVLLCPDGTRKAVTEYESCNLAWVPSHAVVTSGSATLDEINTYRNLLNEAQNYFGEDGNKDFEMFDSSLYQGTDLIFKDSTVKLVNTASTQYKAYLGDAYLLTVRGLSACPEGSARFCVISDGEYQKCQDMKAAFAGENFKPDVSCLRADDHNECMRLIEGDLADLVTLDGGDIVTAGNTYNMQPVAGENYDVGDGSASYWAVAVAKKGTNFGFDELKGRRSCHTGIMKTSGWIVPVGTLIDQGEIDVGDCDVPGGVGRYFSSSCVPGAKSTKYDPANTNPDNLCELCIGEAEANCDRSSREPYYGYTGSFRCLAENAGEVAFVKHVTVQDNTNGNNQDSWAVNLDKADYELLCLNGSRNSVDNWQTCNLARVPSHAVMTSGDKTLAFKEDYWNLLNSGQQAFGDDSGSGFRMFDSSRYTGSDLIFKDSTVNLIDVGEKDTYQEWLGNEYLKSYEAIACMPVGAGSQITASVGIILMCIILNLFRGLF